MTLTAVDCQGFAGGFALGVVQAGFELKAKLEMKGGFGVPNCEANRHLLGDGWEAQVSSGNGEDWDPPEADLLFGNPPCSGFSLMSAKDFRGTDSPINHCMWAFAGQVAKVKPMIAIFESVQQAYTGGLPLMRDLRAKVEHDTGQRWDLYHVLHNAASVGGAAIRKRYFWVVSRIPFGIERDVVVRVPNVRDVIGDLERLSGNTWEAQPYNAPPSWWARRLRSESGAVDGMASRSGTTNARRVVELLEATNWGPKEPVSVVARRHYEEHGSLPESWPNPRKWIDNDWHMGFHQTTRWCYDRMARVVTGGALDQIVHPTVNRLLTHREVARIQGFPDDWLIRPLRGMTSLHSTWGKGIPVDCGRWIGGWAREALLDRPGSYRGTPGEQEREYIINTTNDYRTATDER